MMDDNRELLPPDFTTAMALRNNPINGQSINGVSSSDRIKRTSSRIESKNKPSSKAPRVSFDSLGLESRCVYASLEEMVVLLKLLLQQVS